MAFSDDMMGMINKGIAASKDILSKAADKAQELGRKGMVKVELMQLESQLEKALLKLGHLTYVRLVEEKAESLSASDEKALVFLKEIEAVKVKLDKKKLEYDAL